MFWFQFAQQHFMARFSFSSLPPSVGMVLAAVRGHMLAIGLLVVPSLVHGALLAEGFVRSMWERTVSAPFAGTSG